MEISSFASAMRHVVPGTFVPDLGDETPNVTALPAAGAMAAEQSGSFTETLKGFLSDVNDKIQTSDTNTRDLAAGRTNDLGKVVTSVEEANMALDFTTALQSKVISAYTSISQMQV